MQSPCVREAQIVREATCQRVCENRSVRDFRVRVKLHLLLCISLQMQVECVVGHCSSGRMCSNQRFQGGESIRLFLQHSDTKGIALFADQSIPEEEFVIQYAGEVNSRVEYRLWEKESMNSSPFIHLKRY
jgi:hypothetical protein